MAERDHDHDAAGWRKCNVAVTLDLIGGRWKAVILFALLKGSMRFNAIQRYIQGISHKVLTQELRDLEACGAICRTDHETVPPKVDYALTDLGRSLEPVLIAMRDWGDRHRNLASDADEQGACRQCGGDADAHGSAAMPLADCSPIGPIGF